MKKITIDKFRVEGVGSLITNIEKIIDLGYYFDVTVVERGKGFCPSVHEIEIVKFEEENQ